MVRIITWFYICTCIRRYVYRSIPYVFLSFPLSFFSSLTIIIQYSTIPKKRWGFTDHYSVPYEYVCTGQSQVEFNVFLAVTLQYIITRYQLLSCVILICRHWSRRVGSVWHISRDRWPDQVRTSMYGISILFMLATYLTLDGHTLMLLSPLKVHSKTQF